MSTDVFQWLVVILLTLLLIRLFLMPNGINGIAQNQVTSLEALMSNYGGIRNIIRVNEEIRDEIKQLRSEARDREHFWKKLDNATDDIHRDLLKVHGKLDKLASHTENIDIISGSIETELTQLRSEASDRDSR